MEKVLVNLHGKEHQMRRKVEAKILKPNFFRWYETEVFKKTLEETINPYLKEGKADLVDLAYRILLNLTADFSGIDRPEKSFDEMTHEHEESFNKRNAKHEESFNKMNDDMDAAREQVDKRRMQEDEFSQHARDQEDKSSQEEE